MEQYYIAYGSNLNKSQMKQRCKDAVCVGSSMLENYKLKFNYYLTVEYCENEKTPIGVWKISKEDELALDEYEVYPTLYRKEYVNVTINNQTLRCVVYIMNYNKEKENVSPTDEYFNVCLQGYEDFNLDSSYLYKAKGSK